MIRRHLVLFPLLALLLAGCAGAGAPPPHDLPVAPAWSAANAAPRGADGAWWQAFGDPVLDRLESAAMADSPDIAVALARVDQARALARAARASRLPSGQLQGTLARQRQSLDSGLGQLTRYVPTLSRTQNQGDVEAGISWDLDLAGGIAAQARGAGADALAAAAGEGAARLAVASEVADAYFAWRGARADLALLQHSRALVAERVRIVGARLRDGDAALREREDADATLAALDAALADAGTAVGVARNRIAVLTGRMAEAPLPELDAIPAEAPIAAAPDPAAGVPADLLRRRPDLVLAEARLTGAHARIGAALAEYWPHVTLQGLFGFASNNLSLIGTDSSNVITGAVGLRWRLFDFGRVDAEVKAARGAEREALASYRGQVLAAGGDVENAFLALSAARTALAAREAADHADAAALTRIDAAAREGETSRFDHAGAEARRIDSARALIAARATLARAVVACHRALGG